MGILYMNSICMDSVWGAGTCGLQVEEELEKAVDGLGLRGFMGEVEVEE